MAGHFGLYGQVDYAASKFAARGFLEALSAEIKMMPGITGVKVSVCCPGPVETPLFKGFGEGNIKTSSLVLKPKDVAQSAINAIETGQEQVILPGWAFNGLLMLKVQKFNCVLSVVFVRQFRHATGCDDGRWLFRPHPRQQ